MAIFNCCYLLVSKLVSQNQIIKADSLFLLVQNISVLHSLYALCENSVYAEHFLSAFALYAESIPNVPYMQIKIIYIKAICG